MAGALDVDCAGGDDSFDAPGATAQPSGSDVDPDDEGESVVPAGEEEEDEIDDEPEEWVAPAPPTPPPPAELPDVDALGDDDDDGDELDAVRLRNAVTSPPVGTIATTVHPSADLSVS